MVNRNMIKTQFSRTGGIFKKWLHICGTIDVFAKTATMYINGEFLGSIVDDYFVPLEPDGLLVIGRDQDSYGGSFGSNDIFFGDVTLFNIWDYLISVQEVEQIYSGPGTERGNFLAWVDIKKYLHGNAAFRDNPVLKWEGGGCRWEQTDCNEESGVCKGGLFRCPCSSSLTAPRSCVSSDVYKTKPCSDHNYYLEFPSTYTRARIKMNNYVLHRTWYLTVCVWIKFPPGSINYHSVVLIGVPSFGYSNFHLYLRNDQNSFAIHEKIVGHLVWTRTETYADNKWFHLCAVQDLKTFKMYRNGVQLGQSIYKSLATAIYGHNEIYIGDSPTISNAKWSFIGSMAHLNIWNKALSSGTITSIADGGNTYVGNLLGWPDLIKYAVPGSISVRRPSPVMKWSDTNCHWSKTTCIAGELCNNAKYVCPPLQLNEVSPHSCGVSSYDMNQDEGLKRHLVVDLLLVSRNMNTMQDLGIWYSSIFVNEIEHKMFGGGSMHFVVLNALTGSFIKKFSCVVMYDSTCGDTLEDNLNKIRIERIMLMVITDSPGPHFGSAIPAMHSTFGEELHITNMLETRQPISMLGYSGFNDVSWRESKVIPVGKEPSIIKLAVPLVRESCLDHMYLGERKNGKYVIYPRGGKEMTVYCDFTTNGGGWTVIQRRNKGETVFPVSVGAYDNSFGPVGGEFWLGNKNINRLGAGQMLAIIHKNSTSVIYDLYNNFHVRQSSVLDVSSRSGTMPEGLLNTKGVGPLVFAAPKGLSSPSQCVQPSDGGWWFHPDNCDGDNLNAEKKQCQESGLGTEMLFRQRLPSHDIVIKEISMTMTYQDGMDACLNDGLRLCSSMEICRDGKNVTGGSVKYDTGYWVPIADYYNNWISIDSLDEAKICEIEYNPAWGTDGVLQEYKGKTYCCKHYVDPAKAKLPVKLTMPATYTYDLAVEKCKAIIGQQLCTRDEICPDNIPVYGIKMGLDRWTPASDTYNEWIQVGDNQGHGKPVCSTHSTSYGLPDWGITAETRYYKGLDVFCCPVTKAKLPVKLTMPATYTYDLAVEKCKAIIGQQLCTRDEICPDNIPVYGIKMGLDRWTPASDTYNEWIQLGDNQEHGKPVCSIHSTSYGLPDWGITAETRYYKGLDVFCCPVIKGQAPASKYTVPDTYSYTDGMDECAKKRQRLCTLKEICPDGVGKKPLHGKYDTEMWARLLDRKNDWVQVGTASSVTSCKGHFKRWGTLPSWGENNNASPMKIALFCCPLIYEGRIARTWKYDLKFHGNLSYVRFPKITPLQTSTICWWVLLNVKHDKWKTVFSYQRLDTNEQMVEFAVKSDRLFRLTIGSDKREGQFPALFVDNHEYHHICVLWNWLTQSAQVYRDGMLVSSFSGITFPATPPSGSLVIGQSYIDTSKSFDPDGSFSGVITRFNIWDYELDDDVINKRSLVCGEEEGSIIAWPEVKLWTFDGVEIIEGDNCFPENCLDYLYRNKRQSGEYEIRPLKDQSSFRVYCDQDTGTGTWINIGKRADGGLSFYDKTFKEFRSGFGDLTGEFWLGHEKIHLLTSAQIQQSLLTGYDDQPWLFVVLYGWFMLGREDADYKLHFSSPVGSGNKLLADKPFVTSDRDGNHLCGQNIGSYWHKTHTSCVGSNLFGKPGEGGPQGAQWWGQDRGKVAFWQWKIKSSHEFKKKQPVMYWTGSDTTWSFAKDFCESRGAGLCLSSVLCSPERDPFGAYLHSIRRTPIADSYGKWLNIGESSSCNTESPADGNNNNPMKYKRRVICCHGYPKRDWRYDLRFSQGSNGYIHISRTAHIEQFAICWWLRTTPFTQDYATVFTLHFSEGMLMKFTLHKDGTLEAEFDVHVRKENIPSAIDGNWHHYCLFYHLDHIDFFYDGEQEYTISLGSYTYTLGGKQLFIGQDMTSYGGIVADHGLIGELSRFNFWLGTFTQWEVRKMAKKCGDEVGSLVAWPEVKYHIVGDVVYTSGTTCIKPERHFWPFSEVNEESNAYKDVSNDYDLTAQSYASPITPGKVLTFSEDKQFIQKKDLLDDCLADPELCRRTGLTIGLWLKRKGLHSKILLESDAHYLTLLKWLDAAASGVSNWLLCYNHTGPNMDLAAFHEGCDYVGATVTLVKVGDYVFGGFSNENWGGSARHISSHSSFLFSIYNPSNIGPVKFEVITDQNAFALYTADELGPTFGKNYDLKITSAESSSSLGQTYSGIAAGSNVAGSFFTSTELFTVDQIEIFYAYVPSEAVGIEFPSVIQDDQITASYYEILPEYGSHNARLHSTERWRAVGSDTSPWLQVKLNDVAKIKKIAMQGCGNTWVETFRLSFSMDGIYWTSYKEDLTEKVLTGNSSDSTVNDITLQNAVETKNVRITVVDKGGNGNACTRIELYATVQVCPTTANGAVTCPEAKPVIDNGNTVTEAMCTSFGCCFLNSMCYSKQETVQDVGMQSGDIPNESITASSSKLSYRPYTARFNSNGNGWKSSVSDFPQWLQVELNQDEMLTHVATQGVQASGVVVHLKAYKLYYRKASDVFAVYMENGHPRVFEGYADRTKTIKNLFLNPFVARFVRLYPQLIPTELVRIELYRAVKGSRTNVITTTYYSTEYPTGISLRQHTLMQYRFAVQTDSAMWEVYWEWITYQWTHLTFTWSEKSGIQFYENGNFKIQSKEPSQFIEAKFVRSSDKLIIGWNNIIDAAHIFDMANLFVLKRFVLPDEAKSLMYDVPCSFGDTSQCVWSNTTWIITDLPTPSNHTGPNEGFKIKDFPNLALATHVPLPANNSLAVDGSLDTCTILITQPSNPLASEWILSIGELRRVELVVIFSKPEYDPDKHVQYNVKVYSNENSAFCYEFNEVHREYETARSFHCNQTFDVSNVSISNVDTSMPLTLCEVAVYTMASDKFAYMESSYPLEKGFSGVLTTTYFAQYNCLHFSYHMHGKNMGRLNVFGPESKDGNQTLLWRIAGDQGYEWQSAVVKLEHNKLQDFYEVTFEGVVGDGYMSDIALDNVVFTVDGQCSTYPPAAVPTISVASPKHDCSCLRTVGTESETHLTIAVCNTLSQDLQWLSDGLLQLQGKCLRPATNDVIDGTKLVLSTSCNPNEVAFRLTPSGAIQHVTSLLCVQSTELRNGVKEGDILALGRQGCYDVKWSWTTILLKGGAQTSYSKLNVLKLGVGEISCGNYDGSMLRFIPTNVETTQSGALVVSYDENTDTYRSATVVEVHENNASFVVSLNKTESVVVSAENTTKTPNQPVRGSSILGTRATPTRILSEWLAALGIFSEFWRPCVYVTPEGTSKFNCSLEEDVPSLLLIRKERVVVGGYMDRKSSKPNGNFLFSLKESSSSKFNEASGNGGASAVLTESGMSFGGDELAITWSGEPAVKNVPGNVFGITDLNSMAGVEQFTAHDFEVLQPKDEICVPRCKANEVCDQITGKCICDSTDRPPAWCLTGAASETIYGDAQHYWSMDSKLHIIDEKAENSAWALVEGDLNQNIGVNGLSIEVKNSNGTMEILSDKYYFQKPRLNKGFTISFWFKSTETEGSSIQDRMFLQTSYNLESHTGYFMYQGNSPREIVFKEKRENKECIYTFYIEPNLWTFVTFVTFQKHWKILLNGVNVNVEPVCSPHVSDKNPHGKLILGNGGSDCSVMFDDVAVWYRVLEESEVETIYRYYYKEPPMLTASLEVRFDTVVWEDELVDKESNAWKSLENEVYTKFGSMFPGHENTSFSIDKCRNESGGNDSIPVCNVRLTLNGSDYEMVEILEDKNIILDLEISNLKTDKVPYNATVLKATNPEASKIILKWTSNLTNLYQGFLISYVNNKTNETFNVTVNKFESSYELRNLTGYSHYFIKFTVYTLAGIGKWREIVVKTIEDVPKYQPSNLTGHNASSTELYLTWDPVPEENTFKKLNGYVVYVIEADTSRVVKNITTTTSTLEVHIDDLRKFRTYTLYIRAYSIDVGVQSVTLNLTTAEDAPDAPPDNFQVFNSSSRSLRIEFNPVPPDLINGILRGYRVFYWKTREGNHTRKNFTITKEPDSNSVMYRRRRRSVGQYHEGYPLFANIYNLEEFTNYTVQIQAITILDGVMAPPFTTLTGEDLPSMAPLNVTARNTSSTSVLLEWDLIPEDDRNGIILGYMIYYTGRSGVEQTFVHDSTSLYLDLQGLEKFTEYSFELTVFNSIGESNRSEIVFCKTDQDRPDLPPQDIVGTPTSPSTMGIVWKPVPFPFGRGIILGYRFVFSTMSGEILEDKILAPEEDFISVGSLEIFTNYTLNMTAFTIKGDGPWASKVVLSLQIAPTIPPLNLTADSFYSLNSLPVHWIKVPPELTKGYILGYRLYTKLITVGLEEVPDARETEIILKGQPSSYVFEGLDFFAKYQIYLIAYTVGGDSPRSNTIYAETCRCGPTLTTQWSNLAPYTNITNPEYYDKKILKYDWGIFPYIVNDAVVFCCQTCKSHNYSSVSFEQNYHGQPSEVFGYEALVNSIDGLTDLTFPIYGYVGMSWYHHMYKYTPLIESPGSAFLVRKEKSNMSELLMSNILGNWPLAVMTVCMAFAAGAIMWWLEKSGNSEEFPPSVIKGILNGFWWAYVTMTTVGYGDRSPRTTLGRLFAITWTLGGLVVTGIMVGNLTSSLTVSVSQVEKIIYGAKVGALDLSPEFRLGIRLNAKMNTVRAYQTLDELYEALLNGEVDGILLDAYIVGSRKDLFKNPNLLVNKIKDYRAAYGIVWAGQSSRMTVCLDWYMKSRKSKMFRHIAGNLEMVRKIDKIDVQEEMANIFDPTTKIYRQTLFLCLAGMAIVVGLGLIYELIRRRRLATKVKPQGENEMKNQCVKTIDQCVLQTTSDIVRRAQAMKTRHIQQLRRFRQRSWFKKSKVCPSNVTECSEVSEADIT